MIKHHLVYQFGAVLADEDMASLTLPASLPHGCSSPISPPPARGASSNLKQASCTQDTVRLAAYRGLICVCLTDVPIQPQCLCIDGGFYVIYM